MRRQILLADDSITIQKVIELTFMDGDFDLVSVGNGDAALAKLDQSRPDAVIADIHMPGATGYEICRIAKARYPGIPVVLLVGTFEPFDHADAEAAGADSVLKKPFDSQDLLATVRSLLEAAPDTPAPAPPVAELAIETAEDDLELDSWEKLEIADEPAADLEAGPEPVWGNFDVLADDTAAEADRSPIGFELSDVSATLRPESGFSTLAFSRSELTIEEPAPEPPAAEPSSMASWLAEPAPAVPTPISPVWNAPEIPSPPAWPEASPEPVEEEVPIIELAPPEPVAIPVAPRMATPELAPPIVPVLAEPVAAAPVVTAPVEPMASEGEAAAVSVRLSDGDVERIARRVVELLGDHVVREVAWEVVPDLAELAIKDRLRELEAQVEN